MSSVQQLTPVAFLHIAQGSTLQVRGHLIGAIQIVHGDGIWHEGCDVLLPAAIGYTQEIVDILEGWTHHVTYMNKTEVSNILIHGPVVCAE